MCVNFSLESLFPKERKKVVMVSSNLDFSLNCVWSITLQSGDFINLAIRGNFGNKHQEICNCSAPLQKSL